MDLHLSYSPWKIPHTSSISWKREEKKERKKKEANTCLGSTSIQSPECMVNTAASSILACSEREIHATEYAVCLASLSAQAFSTKDPRCIDRPTYFLKCFEDASTQQKKLDKWRDFPPSSHFFLQTTPLALKSLPNIFRPLRVSPTRLPSNVQIKKKIHDVYI